MSANGERHGCKCLPSIGEAAKHILKFLKLKSGRSSRKTFYSVCPLYHSQNDNPLLCFEKSIIKYVFDNWFFKTSCKNF